MEKFGRFDSYVSWGRVSCVNNDELLSLSSITPNVYLTSLNPHSATLQSPTRFSFLSTFASLWYSTSAFGQTVTKGDDEMKLTATAATVTILVVLLAGTASAWEAESGNEFYELLTSKSPYSRFVAEGYILGVIDTTHSVNRVWHLPVQWTIPAKATKRQVFEAVKKYLDQHPEERDKTAYLLVNIALGSAFPPKK